MKKKKAQIKLTIQNELRYFLTDWEGQRWEWNWTIDNDSDIEALCAAVSSKIREVLLNGDT